MGGLVRSVTSWPHASRNATPLSHRAGKPSVYPWYTRLLARQSAPVTVVTKRTNAIPVFLSRRYRIDAGPLRITSSFKDRSLLCAMNTPLNISQGRRFAQAALKSCGSLEQRLDLGTCPTFISSNAEIAACRTSMKHTKSLEWRCRRVVLQTFKRATIERAATIQSSNQECFSESSNTSSIV
jgi:hypothetical protein